MIDFNQTKLQPLIQINLQNTILEIKMKYGITKSLIALTETKLNIISY